MIVLDTTVWVDLITLRTTDRAEVARAYLLNGASLCATDVMCAELLSAPHLRGRAELVASLEMSNRVLTLQGIDDMRVAADCMRSTIQAGRTVRSMTDSLIAAVCIREGVPLLHNDRDFDTLAELTDLQVLVR